MSDAAPAHRLVIGMEVHVQLRTATKCYCACAVAFGAEPNTNVCPVCLGLPGSLPALNRGALEQAIRGGLGLGCTIASFTKWDRKNYFYPDLPKGYQITQYDKPLCVDGELEIEGAEGPVRVRVQRAHLEEDTGKLTHAEDGASLVDHNRCGVPLLEIVTHPDLHSADEASAYLEELKRILQYLEVSDCDMEKGQLRCEPNVNVEVDVDGAWVPTRIVELKNLNSFAAVRNAIEYERVRQLKDFAATGVRGPRPKSTRGWDDAQRRTYLQREKEEAHDYRYFPEPDLPPVTSAATMAERIRETMPELPRARRERFVKDLELPPADAAVLTSSRALADWFEAVAETAGDAKLAANWTMTDVRREMNARGLTPETFPVPPQEFGTFVRAVAKGKLPREAAKTLVFPEMVATGRAWEEIVAEKGLAAVSGGDLEDVVRQAIDANPDVVAKYRAGKTAVKGVLVGDVMKRTRGSADPKRVAEVLERLLA